MDQAWATVVGMSIAYLASFLGMGLAWYGWNRRHPDRDAGEDEPGGPA